MRRWLLIAAAAITVVAVLLFVLRDPGEAPAARPTADAGRETAIDRARPAREQAAARRRPIPWDELPAPAAPVIDGVDVEKTSVCAGEEVLVTVRAHTEGGADDAFLHGSVGHLRGLTVPLVVAPDEHGEMPPVDVVVHGRGGHAPTVVQVPRIEIRDCLAEYRLAIATRARAGTFDEYDLVARIHAGGEAAPFVPTRYRWDFGDGVTHETTEPSVTHSYAARPQDRLHSDLIVSAEAEDAAGRTVRGRITLALRNPAFEALHREGKILVMAQPEPRVAVRDADGVIRQQVRLWHTWEDDVVLTAGSISTDWSDGSSTMGKLDGVTGAIGLDVVPPDGAWVEITIPADEASRFVRRTIRVTGESRDGVPAAGELAIAVQVTDPELEEDLGRPKERTREEAVFTQPRPQRVDGYRKPE